MGLRVIDELGVVRAEAEDEVRVPGWTEERFFAEGPDEGFFELRDGELIVHAPASFDHQDVAAFLGSLLRVFASGRNLGRLVYGPAVLKVRDGLLREPDLLFVSNERLASVTRQYAGAADFVVEVLSAGGRRRDLEEKAEEYASAGVGEYWVVDPERREVVVHRLDAASGGAGYAVETRTEGRLESTAVPGFWIEVGWLWERPLPSEFDCLRELTG
jgi:Uma2 family endonuclease